MSSYIDAIHDYESKLAIIRETANMTDYFLAAIKFQDLAKQYAKEVYDLKMEALES